MDSKLYNLIVSLLLKQYQFEIKQLQKTQETSINKLPGDFGVSQKFWLEDQQIPYRSSIELLESVRKFSNPVRKMIQIQNVTRDFCKEIDIHKIKDQQMNLELDSDTILSLFIYCVARSCNPDIQVHVEFINLFSSQEMKDSVTGYYVAVLEASIKYLLGIMDNTSEINNGSMIIPALSSGSFSIPFKTMQDKNFD